MARPSDLEKDRELINLLTADPSNETPRLLFHGFVFERRLLFAKTPQGVEILGSRRGLT